VAVLRLVPTAEEPDTVEALRPEVMVEVPTLVATLGATAALRRAAMAVERRQEVMAVAVPKPAATVVALKREAMAGPPNNRLGSAPNSC
jgi:hypothetical protein